MSDISKEEALAEMLAADGLLFGPDDDMPGIEINCNDLFYWACADSEPLPEDDILPFYRAWKAGKDTEWVCVRRNLRPQVPIVERMKERGEWTDVLEALPAPGPS